MSHLDIAINMFTDALLNILHDLYNLLILYDNINLCFWPPEKRRRIYFQSSFLFQYGGIITHHATWYYFLHRYSQIYYRLWGDYYPK